MEEILTKWSCLTYNRTLVTFTMSVLEQKLVREVESVPEFLKQEVLDFVLFLKGKHLKKGITKTPGVCGGEACVEGTRLAVPA